MVARLSAQVDSIEQQVETRLLDPERGLFSRVRDADAIATKILRDTESTRIVINSIADDTRRHERLLTKIEEWIPDHERRDNELRDSVTQLVTSIRPLSDEQKRRNDRKPWVDKVIWLVAALVVTTFLTQAARFVIELKNIVDLKQRQPTEQVDK